VPLVLFLFTVSLDVATSHPCDAPQIRRAQLIAIARALRADFLRSRDNGDATDSDSGKAARGEESAAARRRRAERNGYDEFFEVEGGGTGGLQGAHEIVVAVRALLYERDARGAASSFSRPTFVRSDIDH
jgi:hypothetical protein